MAAKCVWSLDWIFVSLKWLLIFLPINTVRGRQRDLSRLLYTVEAEKKAILCRTVGGYENQEGGNQRPVDGEGSIPIKSWRMIAHALLYPKGSDGPAV